MNITVVGGGTAGWLAAFILSKRYGHNITVIESSKIGIIGVGEGGTHVLGSLINGSNDFGFDPREFMDETDGTPKLTVQHIKWPNTYYIPLDLLPNTDHEDFLPFLLANNKPIHLLSDMGIFIDESRMPIREDEKGMWPAGSFSFHFDGHKVGKYLKKKSTEVTTIDDIVKQVVLAEDGSIASLELESGNTVTSDLYIDCTGFQKVLMNALGNKWISYSEHLLMNTAIPFRLPYLNGTGPLTKAEALSAGWTWNIPLIDKTGLGYVYCDKFITYEQAVKELEERYEQEINIVKTIKFNPGRLEKTWVKNCVSLGLASAFVEPLEATSIHATNIQIDELGKRLLNWEQEIYNEGMSKLYDDIKDFIVLHYKGGRDDSEFWRHVNTISTPRVDEILEIAKTRMLTAEDIPNPFNSLSYRAWNQVLAGLGKFSPEVVAKSLVPGVEERYNEWYQKTVEEVREYKDVMTVLIRGEEWWL